jgi:CHAD domain-containing protein
LHAGHVVNTAFSRFSTAMGTMTPRTLLQRHLNDLLAYLPAVFDGDVEGVHQARIATRRLREVLPLALNPLDPGLVEAVKAAGQHLGRTRELDVMVELLAEVGDRAVSTAGVAAVARQALRARQLAERRSMVKALEELELEQLRRYVAHRRWVPWATNPAGIAWSSEWRTPLRASIGARAVEAADAVRHATGIYFPNRSHRARVAIKKLRYAVEVAMDTGVWQPARLLKDLRRAQSRLGAIHDLQVLSDGLDDLVGAHAAPADVAALRATLHDDILRQHAEYLRRRDRIFAMADACQRASRKGSARARLASSIVAVPLLLVGRRQAG